MCTITNVIEFHIHTHLHTGTKNFTSFGWKHVFIIPEKTFMQGKYWHFVLFTIFVFGIYITFSMKYFYTRIVISHSLVCTNLTHNLLENHFTEFCFCRFHMRQVETSISQMNHVKSWCSSKKCVCKLFIRILRGILSQMDSKLFFCVVKATILFNSQILYEIWCYNWSKSKQMYDCKRMLIFIVLFSLF